MSEIGQKLIAAVRARAAADPGKVYKPPLVGDANGCVNVYNGEGSCIVGCGALDAGLITLDYEFNGPQNTAGVHSLNAYLDGPLDAVEVSWLASVQVSQDREIPWGVAVLRADEVHPLDAK